MTTRSRQGYLDADAARSVDGASVAVALAASRFVHAWDGELAPGEAMAAAQDLSAVAERALHEAVARARAAGQSWSEIGGVLGTSRQAAFQRFGHAIDVEEGAAPPGVAAGRANEFLRSFTAGEWQAVLRALSEPMRERHDVGRLASGWAQLVGMFGTYERMGPVSPIGVGDGTVIVDVLLHFEAGEAMLWARFDAEGKVTGLRLHPVPPETT